MIKNNTKKLLLLNFCLLFFFMNNTYIYSSEFKEKEVEFSKVTASIYGTLFGLYFFALGIFLKNYDHQKRLDNPITHDEKVLFMMRQFLPKEGLEKLMLAEQNTAIRKKEFGKYMMYFGLLCIPASLLLINLDNIFNALFKKALKS